MQVFRELTSGVTSSGYDKLKVAGTPFLGRTAFKDSHAPRKSRGKQKGDRITTARDGAGTSFHNNSITAVANDSRVQDER